MGELCYVNYISVKLLKSIAQKYTVDFPVVHPVVHSLPYNDSDKESTCQCRRLKFNPQFREIPWSRPWQPTTVGQRSLVGCSPWGCKRVEDNSATEQQVYNTYFYSWISHTTKWIEQNIFLCSEYFKGAAKEEEKKNVWIVSSFFKGKKITSKLFGW